MTLTLDELRRIVLRTSVVYHDVMRTSGGCVQIAERERARVLNEEIVRVIGEAAPQVWLAP